MTVLEVPEALRQIARRDEPLWPMTSLRVGGPARWFVRPTSSDALQRAVAWAATSGLPWMPLGAGTDVIFSDAGYPGVVISTQFVRGVRMCGTHVTASCGEPLPGLVQQLSDKGLSGLEWAVGIPGTIGGSIAANAGAYGADMASVLECVTLLRGDAVVDVPVDDLGLAYRTSAIRSASKPEVVLHATLRLAEDRAHRCRERSEGYMAQRRVSQPIGASAGCIFRNPEGTMSAGEALDRAGCKGLRVGSAVVSDRHANFILNEGRNNASEVLWLIEQMHDRVQRAFGVDLIPEVEIIDA